MSLFPIEKIDKIRFAPQDYKLMERVPVTKPNFLLPHSFFPLIGDEIPFVFLDVETTGLTAGIDKIIELGMVKALYSPSAKQLTSLEAMFNELEDPQESISSELTELTGITTEMVKGKRFDNSEVISFLKNDPIIIAHNADFDRKFFENRFPNLSNFRWECSCHDLDWKNKGFGSKSLTSLLAGEGYFFEAHRASTDCLSTAWLFHTLPDYLDKLHIHANTETLLLKATGSPFSSKDTLKSHGYKWNGAERVWEKEITHQELLGEQEFLDAIEHYAYSSATTVTLTARTRHR